MDKLMSLQEHVAREINWLANKKYNLYHVDKDVSMDLAQIAIAAVNSYKHPLIPKPPMDMPKIFMWECKACGDCMYNETDRDAHQCAKTTQNPEPEKPLFAHHPMWKHLYDDAPD